jgi:hypothetical protein
LDLLVYLRAVNGRLARGFDTEADLIASDFQDGDFQRRLVAAGVSDEDGLVKSAGENKHGGLPSVVE